MRISDWSSDVCSSDLIAALDPAALALAGAEDMELAVGGLARDQRADLPRPDIERRDDLFDARRRHRSNPRSTGWRRPRRPRRACRRAWRARPVPRAAGEGRSVRERACRSEGCRTEEHTTEPQAILGT